MRNSNTTDTMMRPHGLFCGALLMAGAVALASADATAGDVLFDTFGTGDEYNFTSSWASGSSFGFETWNAMPFELGSGEFSNINITVPMAWEDSSNAIFFAFQLKIYADDGTNQDFDENPVDGGPGTLIESLNLSAGLDLPEAGDGPYPLSTFEFEDAVLQGSTRYWLSLETDLPADGAINWYTNSIGHQDFIAQKTDNGSGEFPDQWTIFGVENSTGAMRITGTAVPAPGALAVLGVGLGAARRRRRS